MERKIINATKLQWRKLFKYFNKSKKIFTNFKYKLDSEREISISYRDKSTLKEERGMIMVSFTEGREFADERLEKLKKDFEEKLMLRKEDVIEFLNKLKPKYEQVIKKTKKQKLDLSELIAIKEDIEKYLRQYDNDAQAQFYMPEMLGKFKREVISFRKRLGLKTPISHIEFSF